MKIKPVNDNRLRCIKYLVLFSSAIIVLLLGLSSMRVYAHGVGLAGGSLVDWQTSQIEKVFASSDYKHNHKALQQEGEACLVANQFFFKLRDEYAFDIDEEVQVDVDFYLQPEATKVALIYHKSGEGDVARLSQLPKRGQAPNHHTITFTLDRARFSHGRLFGTDFAIEASGFVSKQSRPWIPSRGRVGICNVSLRRSNKTKTDIPHGDFRLEVQDENGRSVPARVGLYDHTGRMPLPSKDAVKFQRFKEYITWNNLAKPAVWPIENRSVFYVGGDYKTRLPAGKYDLIISKGPEYHMARQTVVIRQDKTQHVTVKLQRWNNLPAKGWYSGEDHIHYGRNNKAEDDKLLVLTQAEDIHVANILQMGNIANTHFPQHEWKPVIASDPSYILVPGQEDPRTMRRGHTLQLNMKEPLHPAANRYLLYHEILEKARDQGAVTGYAHAYAPKKYTSALRAVMASEIPFGLVDVAEIQGQGEINAYPWFDFLNLGFKLTPSAGDDYPYSSTPGLARTYVQTGSAFSTKAWFDGLKRGKSFVSNGPVLELAVNGQGMGAALNLKAGDDIVIKATSAMNPDLGDLDRLELIEQGDVIKTVTPDKAGNITLHYETKAEHGTWFVVRAYGKAPNKAHNASSRRVAMSGAVYIHVDGDRFWKPSVVPALVKEIKKGLQDMMVPEKERPELCCELWETSKPSLLNWDAQAAPLQERIMQAIKFYDNLARDAAQIEKHAE